MNNNFWKPNTIPYSWYPKNHVDIWCGSDNIQNINPSWTIPITYEFNPQGFRTHNFYNFTNQKVNIALGCSHTMGIGLPIEMTWPFQIELFTGIPTLNLGLGQGSTDTVSRILTNICELFNISSVFILWPSYNRFELYNINEIDPIIPNSSFLEHTWFLDKHNSDQRFYKNQTLVHTLQKLHNFKLHEIQSNSSWAIFGDMARDKMHNGPRSNLNLANMFLTMN